MASSRELLKEWIDAGYGYDPEVRDSLEKMEGLTDELAEQRFLEKYGNRVPFNRADPIENPTIPSMANIIAILGIEDDPENNPNIKNPRTKEQKFLEDFPEKAAEWKKTIEKNKVYGKRGWETVKEIWRQAEHQKMLGDIVKARHDATYDSPYAYYASLMWPRAVEHIANTGDFTAKDILADLGTNVAMAIPGAGFTGLAGKGLSRVAPRVVNYFSSPGRNILEGAVKGAGRMSGNILGNAVVPFASEGLDAAIYDDTDEGMEHRADFSLGDAAIGTAINQGVNRGLMRLAGPMIDRFSANGLARGGMLKARQFLESLGEPLSKRGDDFAADVARRVNIPYTAETGTITREGLDNVTLGGNNLRAASQTLDEYKNAVNAEKILSAIKSGDIEFNPNAAFDMMGNWKGVGGAKAFNEAKENAEASIQNMLTSDHPEIHEQVAKDYIQKMLDIAALNSKEAAPNLGQLFKNNTKLDLNTVLEANPAEVINYAAWHGKGDGRVGNMTQLGNVVNQALPAFTVNKVGSETDADVILGRMPATKKTLQKERKDAHEAPARRNKAADVLSVVNSTPELTEQDKKYLNAIAANPDILKYGYPEDSAAFKIWLLERGNDLLQGTSAFRPTFDVE